MAGGRPKLLTREIVAHTAKMLPVSLYIETVAARLGITSETFRDWIRAGAREQRRREQGKEPDAKLDLHCEFSSVVKKATADAEADYLSQIQAAGTETWTALAWLLERRFPQRWATNRGELRALAKQIAAIAAQGAKGAEPVRTTEAADKSVDPADPAARAAVK